MSVVKGERGETKLAVVDRAEDLAGYTLKIATNENHFPKRYRWCFTGKMCDAVLEFNQLVHEANAIYARTKDEMKVRLQIEMRAIAKLSGLESYVNVAPKIYDVSLQNLENWLNKISYEKTLLIKWRESDIHKLDVLPD